MTLIVAFSALLLNVLLDSVDLAFVSDETLLNFIQLVVDVTLHNLVLTGIMLHRMVRRLLTKSVLVRGNQALNVRKALFLIFEASC
jgi:hypothetical protein